jgi:hypothetical protein
LFLFLFLRRVRHAHCITSWALLPRPSSCLH